MDEGTVKSSRPIEQILWDARGHLDSFTEWTAFLKGLSDGDWLRFNDWCLETGCGVGGSMYDHTREYFGVTA